MVGDKVGRWLERKAGKGDGRRPSGWIKEALCLVLLLRKENIMG